MLLGIRHCLLIGWSFAGGASAEVIAPACSPLSSLHCHHPKSKREETTTVRTHLARALKVELDEHMDGI